jgi:hypothetical protein
VAPTTPDKKSVTAKPDRKAGGLKNKRGPEIFIENIPECFACSNMPQRSPETCRCFVTDVRTRCDWMWKVERQADIRSAVTPQAVQAEIAFAELT